LKPNIAIVGGAGFVGKYLSKHLVRNFQVKILDVQKPPEDLENLVNYAYCDLRNFNELRDGLEDADLAIHTAIVQIPLINEKKSLGYDVNVVGTQNVCKAVEDSPRTKGLILSGTWHTIGERDISGTIDEEFGFRPDKVESRARLYALSKVVQESIVRYYDEMSAKIYGIIRMGTVLGAGMPLETAASIFIKRAIRGESITPFKHSMYRPMLYVDIRDVCKAYEAFALKILKGNCAKNGTSLTHVVNVYYPEPMTILELAETVKKLVADLTQGKKKARLEIVDKGVPLLFKKNDKNRIEVNITKVQAFLGVRNPRSPKAALRDIIKAQLKNRAKSQV